MARTNASDLVVLGAVLIALGILLASNPRCDRGCQTVAEHLIKHGLRDFFLGLGA